MKWYQNNGISKHNKSPLRVATRKDEDAQQQQYMKNRESKRDIKSQY